VLRSLAVRVRSDVPGGDFRAVRLSQMNTIHEHLLVDSRVLMEEVGHLCRTHTLPSVPPSYAFPLPYVDGDELTRLHHNDLHAAAMDPSLSYYPLLVGGTDPTTSATATAPTTDSDNSWLDTRPTLRLQHSKASIRALTRALNDRSPLVRVAAGDSIGRIGSSTLSLPSHNTNSNATPKRSISTALVAHPKSLSSTTASPLGTNYESTAYLRVRAALPLLVRGLYDDERWQVRVSTLRVLAQLGPAVCQYHDPPLIKPPVTPTIVHPALISTTSGGIPAPLPRQLVKNDAVSMTLKRTDGTTGRGGAATNKRITTSSLKGRRSSGSLKGKNTPTSMNMKRGSGSLKGKAGSHKGSSTLSRKKGDMNVLSSSTTSGVATTPSSSTATTMMNESLGLTTLGRVASMVRDSHWQVRAAACDTMCAFATVHYSTHDTGPSTIPMAPAVPLIVKALELEGAVSR
jgi:hypothetical protein